MNAGDAESRMCALVSHVGTKVFHNMLSSDCFCGLYNDKAGRPVIDEEVIAFIERAVNLAIHTDAA